MVVKYYKVINFRVPYVEAVISEIARCYVTTPIIAPRAPIENSVLNGYDIPQVAFHYLVGQIKLLAFLGHFNFYIFQFHLYKPWIFWWTRYFSAGEILKFQWRVDFSRCIFSVWIRYEWKKSMSVLKLTKIFIFREKKMFGRCFSKNVPIHVFQRNCTQLSYISTEWNRNSTRNICSWHFSIKAKISNQIG